MKIHDRLGRCWWALCHGVTSLLLLGPYLATAILVVVGALLTPVFGGGYPVLLLGRVLARAAAAVERARYRVLLAVHVDPPAPRRLPWLRVPLDPVMWRTTAQLGVVSTVGATLGTVLLVLVTTGAAAVVAPFLTDRVHWPFGIPGTIGAPDAVVVAGGLLCAAAGFLLAPALTSVEVAAGRALLRPPHRTEEVLRRRVETLTTTRERTLDSVEAERRRIERDLHDGPQQRLVAVALQLGMAQRALERDPGADVSGFLSAAHGNAREAITDMRSVARGIVPPVLTDRGLDAALSGLAAAAPLPVTVEVRLGTRPHPAAETIAYYCVSEALTNVAKHARATCARVQVWRDGTELRARVSDDGVGGARPTGSGLTGLADRLGAVDGWLQVDSPDGGPTDVSVGLPGFAEADGDR